MWGTVGQGQLRVRGAVALGLVLAGVLLGSCPGALALDPALDVSQYAHAAWKVRDGFVRGAVFAIAQTHDGYLWLGTESGLVRFDGVRAVAWQPPNGEKLPHNFISSLRVSHDGTLWIGTHSGLASWRDGRFSKYQELTGASVLALIEDHEGTVWIGGAGISGSILCAAKGGHIQCYGSGSFGPAIGAIYEDGTGNLWMSNHEGIWRLKPGSPERYAFPPFLTGWFDLTEDEDGILLGTFRGLVHLVNGKIKSYALPGVVRQFQASRLFRSSDGSLWVGSLQGLLHLHQDRTDVFKAVDGLSADFVTSIFEDREGNIWIGTTDGLDRFRDVAVTTISRKEGLSSSVAWSVHATPDGSIWLGTPDGLNQWKDGHTTIYRSGKTLIQNGQENEHEMTGGAAAEIANSGITGNPQSLGQDQRGRLWASTSDGVFYFENHRFIRVRGVPGDVTGSIVSDAAGNIWISNLTEGLFCVRPELAVKRTPWEQLGRKYATGLAADRGGLWMGFDESGIAYLKEGQALISYSASDGLGYGRVNHLRLGSRGALWAATEGGLSRIKDGRIETLNSKNGLRCDGVHWSMEDDDHSVWLSMPCGLINVENSELDAWVADPKHVLKTRVFDTSDGVRTPGIAGGFPPTVTKTPDGKIWFLPRDGVGVIDPRHLPFNKLPPPVHIEQVTADRKTYDPASYGNGRVSLPALIRDLEIDFTALSLVAPEKVRFRYKLEGRDRDWQEAGNRRQAFYSDLPPRNYRFRVLACNNSGVWNEAGAFLDFSVARAYYQTTWFLTLCVAAFLALLWALYQFRLHQLQQRFNAGLEARVNERTRIARELHDSLLQGFQGLMFRLQAVRDLLPGRPAEAIQALDIALERGDKAIAEGRDTVSDLREPIVSGKDILQALSALGEELGLQSGNGAVPSVRVLVDGKPRDLDPLLRDEIYRIAREALRNAFRHAKAQKIEVEITYADSEFLLHVRDNGMGIDPEVANQGARPGHWGLPGMRERAKSFGGNLEVWSQHGAGTEIELTVPAAIAYGKSNAQRRFWFWRRKTGESNGQQS